MHACVCACTSLIVHAGRQKVLQMRSVEGQPTHYPHLRCHSQYGRNCWAASPRNSCGLTLASSCVCSVTLTDGIQAQMVPSKWARKCGRRAVTGARWKSAMHSLVRCSGVSMRGVVLKVPSLSALFPRLLFDRRVSVWNIKPVHFNHSLSWTSLVIGTLQTGLSKADYRLGIVCSKTAFYKRYS